METIKKLEPLTPIDHWMPLSCLIKWPNQNFSYILCHNGFDMICTTAKNDLEYWIYTSDI
jgi:hypothetical protein